MFHEERIPISKDHRPFDHISQLPDIARPTVTHQEIFNPFRNLLDILMKFLIILLDEIFRQRQNIIRPLPKRRNSKGATLIL